MKNLLRKKYIIPIILMIFLLLCFINSNEAFTNIPPSSIGPGHLCPTDYTYKDKYPPCMNGFNCNNETYPIDDSIGICRKN